MAKRAKTEIDSALAALSAKALEAPISATITQTMFPTPKTETRVMGVRWRVIARINKAIICECAFNFAPKRGDFIHYMLDGKRETREVYEIRFDCTDNAIEVIVQ